MKTKLKSILLIAALFGVAAATTYPAGAQTVSTTNEVSSFFGTTEAWLTSFNTNYTFSGVSLEASTGYKQTTGDNAANFVDAQYDFGGAGRFNAGVSFQFSGIGSALNSEEAQFGYAVVSHFDTKVEANLLAGYDSNTRSPLLEPELTIKKKLTANTFAELGISLPETFTHGFNMTPSFKTGVGFTF